MAVRCRFDDLRAGTALEGVGLRGVIETSDPARVVEVLRRVEQATEDGLNAAGYLAYEAAAALDPALSVSGARPAEPLPLPLAWFALFERLEEVPPVAGAAADLGKWKPESGEAEHRAAVAEIHRMIADGLTYQVNLTTRLRQQFDGELGTAAQAIYLQLAQAQRASYHCYLESDRWAVASGSPELFFSLAGGRVVMRPMKGTAPRGRFPLEDAERSERLRSSAKERAENLMIVDLIRNDLGRIAEVGTVSVDELWALERYRTVWQLTSTVSCRVRAGVGIVELMTALFPSGSVTGAPKPSTMGIISSLERSRRGPYCGALGYLRPPGGAERAQFSVGIRTATLDGRSGIAEYGVGGGITWDSDPALEWAEMQAKAAVLSAPPEPAGLIETLAFVPAAGLRNLERHLARLAASAAHLGWAYDETTLVRRLVAAVEGVTTAARLRLLLAADGSASIEWAPLEPDGGNPVRLALDDEPIDSSDWIVFHKTTERGWLERRAARHPEADDVLLRNERGELTEATRANFAAEIGGEWFTPPLSSGCLPGIERQLRLEAGTVTERVLRADDLATASGLAVMSSLRGWRQAVLADQGAGLYQSTRDPIP